MLPVWVVYTDLDRERMPNTGGRVDKHCTDFITGGGLYTLFVIPL